VRETDSRGDSHIQPPGTKEVFRKNSRHSFQLGGVLGGLRREADNGKFSFFPYEFSPISRFSFLGVFSFSFLNKFHFYSKSENLYTSFTFKDFGFV